MITKTTDWGIETTGSYFSQLWRFEVQDPSAGAVGFWREPASRLAVLLLCPHTAGRESREGALPCVFLQGHRSHHAGSTLVPYLPEAPPAEAITLGIRDSAYGFGGGEDATIQSIAESRFS